MKKQILVVSVAAFAFAALFTGCGPKTKTCAVNETSTLGGYKGSHSILGGVYTFDDSLTITDPTPGDNKITIKSEKLGVPLTGTFDPNNCGRVLLDSVMIASQTIGTVTLSNIHAGGYGIINGNKINTVININIGTATIGSTPVSLSGQALTGVFTKQ